MSGTRLVEGQRPFHFLGANVGVMHGEVERRGARATLRAAAADGVRVVRIWALGEGHQGSPPWHRRWQLFRTGPTDWISHALLHLDEVLEEAGALGLRVILVLANQWRDYGGIPQYLRWAGLGDGAGYGDLDRFFSDPRAEAWYWAHLERLLGRRNTVNGLRYVEDPTIMAWELFNESAVTPGGRHPRQLFISKMARRIRARAPRQLVGAGVSEYARAGSRSEWLAVCSLPNIAYCDGHLYPEGSLRVQRREDLLALIDDRVQLAHHVALKPIIFGEYGFTERAPADPWLGLSHTRWHSVFLGRVHENGAAGAMPWIYVPHLRRGRRFAIWTDHRSAEPLRRVLSRWAEVLAAGPPAHTNPLLSAARGKAPFYPMEATVTKAPLEGLAWVLEPGQEEPRVRDPGARESGAGESGAREPGARESGARESGARESGARDPGAREPGARESGAREPGARESGPPLAAAREARGARLLVPVEGFTRARFEEIGVYAGGALVHAHGAGAGYFEYTIPKSPFAAARLWVRLRLSSEFPGAVAPPTGSSRVVLSLGGRVIRRLVVPPDDGIGQSFELEVRDPVVLGALARGPVTLRLEVPRRRLANGLCVYGAPGGRPVAGVKGPVGPIRLRITRLGRTAWST